MKIARWQRLDSQTRRASRRAIPTSGCRSCSTTAPAVLDSLDEFTTQVAAAREALIRGDADEIRRLWEQGKSIREQLKVRRVAE